MLAFIMIHSFSFYGPRRGWMDDFGRLDSGMKKTKNKRIEYQVWKLGFYGESEGRLDYYIISFVLFVVGFSD